MAATQLRQQPDIAYQPDRAKWQARTATRLSDDPSLPRSSLPDGFPTKLKAPLVWEGKDWKNEAQWVYSLSQKHLQEIKAAVEHFQSLGLPFGYITPEAFPLPSLGPELRLLAEELYNGRGFFVLREIPVDSYTKEENTIIYAGVSSHVGEKRAYQDANGGVLSHIKDMTPTVDKNLIGGPAYTTDKQVYHTDFGDIIALFALETAAEGGTSRISSSWKVYNELAETRPDIIRTLSEPWPFDGFGATPPYYERPLLFFQDGRVIIQYARRLFTGYMGLPRSTDIPPITEAQAEALDTLHFLGEKYALGLNFTKGDIQYINNMSIFHARDGFADAPKKQRHLLRLWLRNEELGWKLPPILQKLWSQRYGIEPNDQKFPINPVINTQERGEAKGSQY